MSTRIEPSPALNIEGMPERVQPEKEIIVYICPTEGCPGFYAAPNFRADISDIESMQYHRSQNDGRTVASHPRIECPYCRAQGKHVNRVPYMVTEVVPLDELNKFRQKVADLFKEVGPPDAGAS